MHTHPNRAGVGLEVNSGLPSPPPVLIRYSCVGIQSISTGRMRFFLLALPATVGSPQNQKEIKQKVLQGLADMGQSLKACCKTFRLSLVG